jgi:hypothetical protein
MLIVNRLRHSKSTFNFSIDTSTAVKLFLPIAVAKGYCKVLVSK